MAGQGSKLALGTVQFGLDYGVSNTQGKVAPAEVQNILNFCAKKDINTLDTAAAYGDSETVIGQNILATDTFQIVSKLPTCRAAQVKAIFTNSLEQLKKKKIYGYLIHDFAAFTNDPGIFDEIYKLQQEGLVQKIGFSLYFPHQLEEIIKLKLPIQLLQFPFNVFDQRFVYLFSYLLRENIEVHARSVFLQGLVFKEMADLPSYFSPFRDYLAHLQEISQKTGLALSHILLAFAHLQPGIKKIVVGVTSVKELAHNNAYIESVNNVKPLFSLLQAMASPDEHFILPFHWKLS